MERIIKIGDKEIRMRANARIHFEYRYLFGKDLMVEINRSYDKDGKVISYEVFEKMAWIFAKTAGEEVHADLPAEEAVEKWFENFESYYFFIKALPKILDLWRASNATSSVPRKK